MLCAESRGKKIVISEIEPINVLQAAKMMQKFGFTMTKVPVNQEGFINLEKLKEAVDSETILVSVSTVNNEIGGPYFSQPIKEAVGRSSRLKTLKCFSTSMRPTLTAGYRLTCNNLNVEFSHRQHYKILA